MRARLALAVVLAGLHAGGACAQTVWRYWCEPIAAYYPAVQTCPMPWRPVGQVTGPAPSSRESPEAFFGPHDAAQQNSSYQEGVADWRALQAWFQSQAGDDRAGADYWAGNRSRAGHKSCGEASGDFSRDKSAFFAGCQEATRRLDPIDAKRLSDPTYRAGFNDEATQLPILVRANSNAQPPVLSSGFPNYSSRPVYTGPHAPPELSDPDKHSFRTRITAASQQPPNFASRYVISVWGCGTGCAQGVAVNIETGKVVWLPGSFMLEPLDAERFQYQLDSDLLIVNGHESDGDETPYAPRCYVMDDGLYPRLVKIDCSASATSAASTVLPAPTAANPIQPQASDTSPIPTPREGYGGYVQTTSSAPAPLPPASNPSTALATDLAATSTAPPAVTPAQTYPDSQKPGPSRLDGEVSFRKWIAAIAVFLTLVSSAVGYFIYHTVKRQQIDGGVPRHLGDIPMVGAEGVVSLPIVNGQGRMRTGGRVWLIEGPNLPAGAQVVIKALRGTRIIVEAATAKSKNIDT